MHTIDKIMSIYESMDLAELATEAVTAAKDSQRLLKSSVQNAITAGRYLTAAKSKVEHGQWSDWLAEHWESDGRTARTATRYMSLANFDGDLSEAESLRQALDIVAESKSDTRVRFDSEPLKPVTAETVEQSEPIAKPAESTYQPFARAEPDNDPTPQPETTTVYSEETRKVPEAEKPPTQPVPVVDVSVDPIENLRAALADIQAAVPGQPQRKKVAKELRKTADVLDPQKYPIPSVEEVQEYASEKGWSTFNAEKFHNHYELADWKYGKAKAPLKKWKIAASQAWDNGNGWCVQGATGGDPW